jgi:anaerobic magnesium-protoporphyrin IX monomethyl ester cyclase
MRIALVHAPFRTPVSDAIGDYPPLGLLRIGGSLIDAGFNVKFIDAAARRMSPRDTINELEKFACEAVLIGHMASTSGHLTCIYLTKEIKKKMPDVYTVYGGVYPTFTYEEIMKENFDVDFIVRGEGEETGLKLLRCLESEEDLSTVDSVVWRRDGKIVANRMRKPIDDIDKYRTGWELIEDWSLYPAGWGLQGNSAVVQFSRGCIHRCSYCGQWDFWKTWRHRDPKKFVDELEMLYDKYNVRFFKLADENPTTDQKVFKELLSEIISRNMDIYLDATVRITDILRDAAILPLYRKAGFFALDLGMETISDDKLHEIGKGSYSEITKALALLRQYGILSMVNYIYGIEDESTSGLRRALSTLIKLNPDFLNALYLTPHHWTKAGGDIKSMRIIRSDMEKWDYKHQIIATNNISPSKLFYWIKLSELIVNMRPFKVFKRLTSKEPLIRKVAWYALKKYPRLYIKEWKEFFAEKSSFVEP